jgi:hypothetical protein
VIQPILDRRGEADESLRQIVDVLAERQSLRRSCPSGTKAA